MNHVQAETFSAYGITYRPICPADLPSLRRWRNSDAVKQNMVDQSHIQPQQQIAWFKKVASMPHNQAHWTVWFKGVRTGYSKIAGEKGLDNQDTLTVGAYIGDSAVRSGLLGYALVLLQLDIAFDRLHCQRIEMSVMNHNQRAMKFNEQIGYRQTHQNAHQTYFELEANRYRTFKPKVARFLQS